MRTHTRLRVSRILKWMGVALALSLLAAWGVSLRMSFSYIDNIVPLLPPSPIGPGPRKNSPIVPVSCQQHTLQRGVLVLNTLSSTNSDVTPGWRVWREWFPQFGYGLVWPQATPGGCWTIPLWLPLLLIGVPTALQFVSDRRQRRYERRKKEWGVAGPADQLAIHALEETQSTCRPALPLAGLPTSTYWSAKLERLSEEPCFVISGIAALFLFVVSTLLLDAAARIVFTDKYLNDDGVVGMTNLVLLAVVSMIFAYLGARLLYLKLRFRTIWSSTPICANCAYELRGNVSGVCPECGTQV